jgi:aspartate dehydrogenase
MDGLGKWSAGMTHMRLGLIGYGAIGKAIADRLSGDGSGDEVVGALIRSRPSAASSMRIVNDLAALLRGAPTVIIEAAGHDAVRSYGPAILDAGVDLVIASVGALASTATADALANASAKGGHLLIPAGAIAGLDGLVAARLAGLERVTYTSLKPPEAWRGTLAEQVIDLDDPRDEIVFFAGSARRAALEYPKNANVSAAIALAGIGFDRTEVKLVSSRKVTGPLGVIEASGDFGWFDFRISANAFPANPKSSMLTAHGLLQSARLGIGIPLDRALAG